MGSIKAVKARWEFLLLIRGEQLCRYYLMVSLRLLTGISAAIVASIGRTICGAINHNQYSENETHFLSSN